MHCRRHSLVNAEDKNTNKNEDVNTYKKTVTLWYEAFTKKDPALLDQILHDDWVDIPGAPGTPVGPAGIKPLLAQLTTTFPDLKLTDRGHPPGREQGGRPCQNGRHSKTTIHELSVEEPKDRHSGGRYPRI